MSNLMPNPVKIFIACVIVFWTADVHIVVIWLQQPEFLNFELSLLA